MASNYPDGSEHDDKRILRSSNKPEIPAAPDIPGVHSSGRTSDRDNENVGKAELNRGVAAETTDHSPTNDPLEEVVPETIFNVNICYKDHKGTVDLECSIQEFYKWHFLFLNPTKLNKLSTELKKKKFELSNQNYPPCIAVQDLKHGQSDLFMSTILKSIFFDLSSDIESSQIFWNDRLLENAVKQLECEVKNLEENSFFFKHDEQCIRIFGFTKQVQKLVQICKKLKEIDHHPTSNISADCENISAQSHFVSLKFDFNRTDEKNDDFLRLNGKKDKVVTDQLVCKRSSRNVQTSQYQDFKQGMTTIKLTSFQDKLVKGLNMEDWLKEKFPAFRFQHSVGEIIVSGSEDKITSVADDIPYLLSKIEERSKVISLQNIGKMLRDENVFLELKTYLTEHNIECFIDMSEDSIEMYTKQSDELDNVIRHLKEFFVDVFVHLQNCCLDSPLLKQKQDNLVETYKAKISTYSKPVSDNHVQYHFVSTIDIADRVRKDFKSLENDLMKMKKEHVTVAPFHVTFLKNNFDNTLNNLATKFSVAIDCNSELTGLDVNGPAECVKQVVRMLKGSILKGITSKDMHIASQKAVEYIQTKKGIQFLKEVETQNKCTVEKEIVSVSTDVASTYMFESGIVQSTWKFDNHSEIKLIFGDCKEVYHIEVMVRLLARSHVDSVLKEENRGISIRSTKQYTECYASVPVPEYKDGKNKEKDNLQKQFEVLFLMVPEKAVGLSLKDVETTKWKKVIFVKQILFGIQQVMKVHKRKVKFILFVSREEEFKSILAVLKDSLGVKAKPGKAIITQCSESKPVPPKRHKRNPAKRRVTVKRGQLAHQKTDVIVNTTSQDLKLHGGAVSTSIIKTAGDAIQLECNAKYPNGIQYGEVAVTGGHNLCCKYVYHGSLPSWTGSKLDQQQMRHILKTFVTECLYLANEENLKSISFPAMGTGNLGFPKTIVAKDMFDAVYDFESSMKGSTLESVQFVIYDKDNETIQAFEKEEQSRINQPNAARTVQDTTTDMQLQYGRLAVALSTGDVTKHQTMGLMVIWEQDEIYKGIPDRMKYLTDAGKGWDSKKHQLFNSGAVVTNAVKTYTKIIHLKADKSKLFNMVSSALKQAESNYLATIAVPIQRADPVSSSLKKYADAWLDAIKEFEKNRKSKCLRFIRLVFERNDMMEIFRSVLDNRQATKQQFQDPQTAGTSEDDDSETKTVRITVTGNNTSNFDGAFSSIENLIKDLHEEPVLELVENSKLTTESNKSKSKDENASSKLQGSWQDSKEQNEDLRAKKFPDLQMTNDVDCCVIVSMIKGMEKAELDRILQLFNVQFSVLHPYQDNGHALIVCKDVEGAKKFIDLKIAGDVTFTKMDPQVLFNITAEVDGRYLQGFSDIKLQEIKDHISKACGIEIIDSNGGWILSGIIPQIEMAVHILSVADFDNNGSTEIKLPMEEENNLQQNQLKDKTVLCKRTIGNADTTHNGKPTTRKKDFGLVPKTEREATDNDETSTSNDNHKRLDHTNDDGYDDGIFKTSGIMIKVYKCDLVNTSVDCIVNAASPELDHRSGISKAIAKKAGNEFRNECKDFVKNNGPLSVGQTCHTKGGKLNYSFVIHTVGPIGSDIDPKSESCYRDLQMAVVSAILEAEKLKMQSVALPPISIDMCSVIPFETYVKLYPEAVFNVCKTMTHHSSIREIHFVADDKEMVDSIKKAFSDFFCQNANQAAYPIEQLQKDVVLTMPNNSDDLFYPRFCHSKKKTMEYEAQFNNYFHVKIYTGDILNANVKALSCGQDEYLNNNGHIAKAIYRVAGPDYQQPFLVIKKKTPYHLGQVLSLKTRRPILSGVQIVFQAITASWTEKMEISNQQYLKGISTCFTEVIKNAIACKIESLALPLFGTGNAGADFNRPASLLLDSILKILQEHKWPDCSLREVHIVNHDPNVSFVLKDKFQDHIESERKRLQAEKKKSFNFSNGKSSRSDSRHMTKGPCMESTV